MYLSDILHCHNPSWSLTVDLENLGCSLFVDQGKIIIEIVLSRTQALNLGISYQYHCSPLFN